MRAHALHSPIYSCERTARRYLLISFVLLPLLLTGASTEAQASEWGDIPSIKGLDFSKVEIQTFIVVHTRDGRQDNGHLVSHALARLTEHQLVGISPDWKDPKPIRNPRLLITLLAREIPDCPNKLFYVKTIELRELAVREREPQVYTSGVSYGGADLFPNVIELSGATRDRFEKDLDELIDAFAQHYWEWNGKSALPR